MNKNVKIAKQLVKLAKHLIASNAENELKNEIERQIPKIKDPEVQQEIEQMITSSIKTASKKDVKDDIGKVQHWVERNIISTWCGAMLICLLILGADSIGIHLERLYQFNTQSEFLNGISMMAAFLSTVGIGDFLLNKVLTVLIEKTIGKKTKYGPAESLIVYALSHGKKLSFDDNQK